MRILLVEDDRMLGDGVQAGLGAAGFTVDWVRDGEAALAALAGEGFAAVLLDLGLPRRDGLSVLASLRSAGNVVPVMILTARDQISDKVRGLDLGADDYMVKPFELAELEARVRALCRRSGGGAPSIRCGRLVYDQVSRSAQIDGQTLDLSARETGLLEILLSRPGRLVSKDHLVDHLCGWGEEVSHNAIEVYVHRLRKKLEAGGVRIATVRGLGYCLEEPRDPTK